MKESRERERERSNEKYSNHKMVKIKLKDKMPPTVERLVNFHSSKILSIKTQIKDREPNKANYFNNP